MNREELKSLGLTDEQIDKVMAAHGQVVNATKQELQTVTTDRDNLKQQLSDRDTQLTNLKKEVKDNEELTNRITQLEQDNKTTKTDYEEKLKQQAFEHKLESTLSGAKVKNIKAVKALLDLDSIKLDGDKLLGLDDQLNSLKEKESYLFEQETDPGAPYIITGGNPNGGTGNPNPFSNSIHRIITRK